LLDEYIASSDETPLDKIKTVYSSMLAKYARQNCQQSCLVGSLAAEMGNQSESCQNAMLESVANSKLRLSQLLAQAQLAGQIRDDISAMQITDIFWATWEGSLLKMKMQGSTESAKQILYLMLDDLLKPRI
jgi:hypothetical protein